MFNVTDVGVVMLSMLLSEYTNTFYEVSIFFWTQTTFITITKGLHHNILRLLFFNYNQLINQPTC